MAGLVATLHNCIKPHTPTQNYTIGVMGLVGVQETKKPQVGYTSG
jgi:hypothetical protein